MPVKKSKKIKKYVDRKYSQELIAECKFDYITDPTTPSIKIVAERHEINENRLRTIAAHQKWTDLRDELYKNTERKIIEHASDEMADKIIIANKNHVKIGARLQTAGMELFEETKKAVDEKKAELKPGEALRIAVAAIKTGVDTQRKGLGLGDTIIHIQNMREVAAEFVKIISNHVTDPDVIEAIKYDVQKLLSKEEAKFDHEIPDVVNEYVQ